jgi:hypothetical protein
VTVLGEISDTILDESSFSPPAGKSTSQGFRATKPKHLISLGVLGGGKKFFSHKQVSPNRSPPCGHLVLGDLAVDFTFALWRDSLTKWLLLYEVVPHSNF